MAEIIFPRQILGQKAKGCKVDPVTRQSVQFMPHSGDITYPVSGDDTVAKESDFITPSRERILNPSTAKNLNEVGQDKNIITRTALKRYIKLD